jgi:hypothetical protein
LHNSFYILLKKKINNQLLGAVSQLNVLLTFTKKNHELQNNKNSVQYYMVFDRIIPQQLIYCRQYQHLILLLFQSNHLLKFLIYNMCDEIDRKNLTVTVLCKLDQL